MSKVDVPNLVPYLKIRGMWLGVIPSMDIKKKKGFPNQIGLRAQNMMPILSVIVNMNEKTCLTI